LRETNSSRKDAKIRKERKGPQEIYNLPFYYRGSVIAEQPVKRSPQKRASQEYVRWRKVQTHDYQDS
jgi:hypothetical protein